MIETTTQKTTVLCQFLSSADEFACLVRDLPRRMLDCAAGPGEWTVREIVHHVADDADLWSFALKKAIASPGAALRFEGFPGNERWFSALSFGCRNINTALDLIVAHRKVMADVITCSEADWEASYIQVFDDQGRLVGKFNIEQILVMLTQHMNEHLQTLHKIIA